MTTSLAYLFEKISIEVVGEIHSFYQCVDVVYGACYLSRNGDTFHVFTGNYNCYAHILKPGEKCIEELNYVVQIKNFDKELKLNNNRVNFNEIKDNMLQKIPKYFKLVDGNLISLNEEFIKKYIEKEEEFNKILQFPQKYSF